MSVCILEVNDSEVRVCKDKKIILRSPGYAVINKENINLGNKALKHAYLNPRQTYNRFWDKLNQDALQTPTQNYRHHADLAYAHLKAIYEETGKPEEIIFAVPGRYSSQQLSLLLGIAEACPFKAVGLVDIAVASAASVADRGQYQHIDIHLHQAVLTHLDINDSVVRRSVEVVDETGLQAIYNSASSLIADLFIKQSRFDPHHHAETEQALYDQLPRCLKTLQQNKEVLLEISYNNTTHQAKLSREALLQGLQPVYDRILSRIATSIPCLVTDRLAGLPGFPELLSDNHILQPETVFRGCFEHEAKIRSKGTGLDFITTLPLGGSPSIFVPVTSEKNDIPDSTQAVIATHILAVHQAYPLTFNKLYISTHGKPSSNLNEDSRCSVRFGDGRSIVSNEGTGTVLLNGETIQGKINIKPGDTLSFPGAATTYSFICVN